MFPEFLTKAYRKACAEGEAVTYRAHVFLLGPSITVKENVIEGPLDESRFRSASEGIKTYQIKSRFNKATHKTEKWRKSRRDSSEVMTELRHAVLSHIRSHQNSGEVKREIESHFSAAEESERKQSFVAGFESIKNRKRGVRQNIAHKLEIPKTECRAQFPGLDTKTLFFLYKNAHIQDTSDNNIPYSINLWDCDSREEFSTMNLLFLKAETLILYIMDITLDLFSPLRKRRSELQVNEKPKTPAEMLTYWLSLVHVQVKKENFKPNIVLLLTQTDSLRETGRSQYVESYVKTIIKTVKGKPYEDYISNENIISDNFIEVRSKLFERIRKLSNWGVTRPIRWLHLEAELLKRRMYETDLAFVGYDDYGKTPYLLVSEVKNLASEQDMDDREVELFLKFHHTLGDFIYCPMSKGENCVITNPELLMRIFEYIVFTAKRSKGVVTKEYIHHVWGRHDIQLLVDIMISYDLVLPLDNHHETYLVPCKLPLEDSYFHESELTYRAVYIPNIDDRSLPSFEIFHRLLSLCAQQSNWKLNIGDHLSRYHASFDVTMGTHLVLTQMKNNTIQVSTWTSKEELDKGAVSNDEIKGLILDIRKEVAKKWKF